MTLTFDLLTLKYMDFQDSESNISLLSLVSLAAAVLRYRAEKKTNMQTDRQASLKSRPRHYRRRGYQTVREVLELISLRRDLRAKDVVDLHQCTRRTFECTKLQVTTNHI